MRIVASKQFQRRKTGASGWDCEQQAIESAKQGRWSILAVGQKHPTRNESSEKALISSGAAGKAALRPPEAPQSGGHWARSRDIVD